jgi:hypothetical protein
MHVSYNEWPLGRNCPCRYISKSTSVWIRNSRFVKTSDEFVKGQLNSELIYEVIVSPKMPTKIFPDFCPGSLLEGRAEIWKNFGWHFERNDDLINLF